MGDMKMSKVLTINEMQNMSIDNIISMYRDGYTIGENESNIVEENNLSPKIVSAQDGVSVSTGAILIIGIGILAFLYLKR